MIEYSTGVTNKAVRFVETNKDLIGKPISIFHKRNKNTISYVTIIEGTEEKLKINGGLTSGYGGEGPWALVSILKLFGVSEKKAVELVINNFEDEFEFTIQF